MEINAVSPSFSGRLVDNYQLRKFKAALKPGEADIFEKYVNDIGKVKDGKVFAYEPVIIGSRKFAKIHLLDKDGNSIKPAMFYEKGDNALNIFKQLSDWYKSSLHR